MAKNKQGNAHKQPVAVATTKQPTKIVTAATTPSSTVSFIGYCLIGFASLLPFLFSRETSDPVTSVRLIALSVFICGVGLWWIIKKDTNTYPSPLVVKVLLLLCVLYLAWGSIGVAKSINPSLGILDITKFLLMTSLVFLLVRIIFIQPLLLKKLCNAITVVTALQSLIGILQYYGISFNDLPGSNALPYGLMANRNLFGSALVLLLPFCIYSLYINKGFWRMAAISSLVLLTYALLLSQTRSAWLSAVAIVIIPLFLSLLFIRPFNKKMFISYAIAFISIIAIAFFAFAVDKEEGTLSRDVRERVGSLVGKTSKDSINSGAAENVNERFIIWKKTLQIINDNPVWGVGLSNWKIEVPKYGTLGTVWQTGSYVPDRVHNVYLQQLAETGWVGGLLFFSIWLLVGWCGLVSLKKNTDNATKFLLALMLGGLVAFAIDCMFSFGIERIEHIVYLSLIAAIIITHYLIIKQEEKKEKKFSLNPTLVLPIFLIAIGGFGVFLGNEKHRFEKQLPIANAYQKAGKNLEALQAVEEGSSRWVTLNEEGKSLYLYSSLSYLNLKKYEEALQESAIALKLNPTSAMGYNNIGAIYASMNKYDSAAIYYRKAIAIKPKFVEPLKNLAGTYYNLKQYDSCISTLLQLDLRNDTYLTQLLSDAKLLKSREVK